MGREKLEDENSEEVSFNKEKIKWPEGGSEYPYKLIDSHGGFHGFKTPEEKQKWIEENKEEIEKV